MESKAFWISIKITKIFSMLLIVIHSYITLRLKIGSSTDLPLVASYYNSLNYPFYSKKGI